MSFHRSRSRARTEDDGRARGFLVHAFEHTATFLKMTQSPFCSGRSTVHPGCNRMLRRSWQNSRYVIWPSELTTDSAPLMSFAPITTRRRISARLLTVHLTGTVSSSATASGTPTSAHDVQHTSPQAPGHGGARSIRTGGPYTPSTPMHASGVMTARAPAVEQRRVR